MTMRASAWADYRYEDVVRPGRIPQEEIEAPAGEMERRHPDDPDEWAFIEEPAAWHRSRNRERVLWRQVRREIRRRLDRKAPPPQRP